jgi:hypothetical protein
MCLPTVVGIHVVLESVCLKSHSSQSNFLKSNFFWQVKFSTEVSHFPVKSVTVVKKYGSQVYHKTITNRSSEVVNSIAIGQKCMA